MEDDCIRERGPIPARGNTSVLRLCLGPLRSNPLVCRDHPDRPGDGSQERHGSKDGSGGFDHDGLDTDDYWACSRFFFCGWQQSAMAKTSDVHRFMFAGAAVGAVLLERSLALPLAMATISAVCGVAAFYGSRPLERAETPISSKIPNDAQPNQISARTNHD